MTAPHRSFWGRSALAIVAMVAAAVLLTAVLLPAAAATAQPATTVPIGGPRDPDPLNAGGIVFLGISAVLFGGALLLYLRHRPRARS